MATISVNADIPAEQLLEALARLPSAEFNRLFDQINRMRAQRCAPGLPAQQALLLQTINEGLSDEEWSRLKALITKREEESITAHELTELKQLTDQLESLQVRRLRALLDLAQLRAVPLDQLMADLGIRPQGDE